MNKLLLASIIALTSSTTLTSAAPPAKVDPPKPLMMPTACVATGTTVFEVDNQSTTNELPTSSTTIYGTGAWTHVERLNGKITRTSAGCVSPSLVAPIKVELDAAKWTLTYNEIRCHAMSAQYTEYRVGGKLVLTSHTCDGAVLDPASAKALGDASVLVTSLKV
jgi:hypothetical protein